MAINSSTEIGAKFAGKLKTASNIRVLAFSGGEFNTPDWPKKNIHTDLEFAKTCGLKSRNVSGTQCMSYLTELMIDIFGESWFDRGKMELKFVSMVDIGDNLVAKAVVTEKELNSSKTKFTLDIECENHNGNKVVVGTATSWV